MSTQKIYRPGALGALMDEYERATAELVAIVAGLDDETFERLYDAETSDENCRSIQTIVSHVARAAYGYAGYIRTAWGREHTPQPSRLWGREEALREVEAAMAYTVETLEGEWTMSDERIMATRMLTRWGVEYDVEQLLEHAIVHILRHRRQIERFLQRSASET